MVSGDGDGGLGVGGERGLKRIVDYSLIFSFDSWITTHIVHHALIILKELHLVLKPLFSFLLEYHQKCTKFRTEIDSYP